MTIATAAICFIACHGGAANHFATFAKDLTDKGHTVHIHATGPALAKFQESDRLEVYPFSLDGEKSHQEIAEEIAKKCSQKSVVITDLGHTFDIAIQKSLAIHAPDVLRIAYYDNPESYVPGGYSEIASQVIKEADKVLFANTNLVSSPIYRAPSEEISISAESKIGLGYYPLEKCRKMLERRSREQRQIRKNFLLSQEISEKRQKVLVYTGGNNEEYFTRALPSFLEMVAELSARKDLSNVVLILQQHPGAKRKNIDAHLVEHWLYTYKDKKYLPRVVISSMKTDDALVLADAVLYYQTSMGPQFILAGIPTIQVGHEVYKDILVKNNLCLVANSAEKLCSALATLETGKRQMSIKTVEKGLGITPNWSERLEDIATARAHAMKASTPHSPL